MQWRRFVLSIFVSLFVPFFELCRIFFDSSVFVVIGRDFLLFIRDVVFECVDIIVAVDFKQCKPDLEPLLKLAEFVYCFYCPEQLQPNNADSIFDL